MPVFTLIALSCSFQTSPQPPKTISWQKQVIDNRFRAEGVGVADVNKDGKNDILVGELWYEGPDFKNVHEMQAVGDYGTGEKGYSKVFCVFPEDLNGDGYPDMIIIPFPGNPAYWLENPKGEKTHWKKHPIWHSACNETPIYKDLFGDGRRALIMGAQPKGKKIDAREGQMAYFTSKKDDPYAPWEMHPISEPSTSDNEIAGTYMFSHGLGTGDINGDNRLDVITPGSNRKDGIGGWWEQPEKPDGKTPWKFHPIAFNDHCADIFAADLTGDGKADILCTSAHRFGIWQFNQKPNSDPDPKFEKVELFSKLLSETHAAHFVDIDGDGLNDLVTGKRYWSHSRGEKGWDMPAMIYWLQSVKDKDGKISFAVREIDADSGIGTQFCVQDVDGDGLLDVVSANKKGVRIIRQVRK